MNETKGNSVTYFKYKELSSVTYMVTYLMYLKKLKNVLRIYCAGKK